eukprot:2591691-Ditylum_brightwellii.AAC.1
MAYKMLINYRSDKPRSQWRETKVLAFVLSEGKKAKLKNIKCFWCREMGHYKNKCPTRLGADRENKEGEYEGMALIYVDTLSSGIIYKNAKEFSYCQ